MYSKYYYVLDIDLLDLNHLIGVAVHGHVEGGHDEAGLTLSLFPSTLDLTSHRSTLCAQLKHVTLRCEYFWAGDHSGSEGDVCGGRWLPKTELGRPGR